MERPDTTALHADERTKQFLTYVKSKASKKPFDGIAIADIPQALLDPDIFHRLCVVGWVEVFRRNHCLVGGKLHVENGFETPMIWRTAVMPEAALAAAIADKIEDKRIRLRLRLTVEGTTAAERQLSGHGNLPTIPTGKRTIPLPLRRAAKLLGKTGSPKDAAEWLRQSIDDGSYQAEKMSRQNWIFNIDAFPKAVESAVTPQKVAATGGKRR